MKGGLAATCVRKKLRKGKGEQKKNKRVRESRLELEGIYGEIREG